MKELSIRVVLRSCEIDILIVDTAAMGAGSRFFMYIG